MNDMRKARQIVDQECELEGITPGELRDAPRTRTYTKLRHSLITRLREETGLSWREIALILGYGSRPHKQYKLLKAAAG